MFDHMAYPRGVPGDRQAAGNLSQPETALMPHVSVQAGSRQPGQDAGGYGCRCGGTDADFAKGPRAAARGLVRLQLCGVHDSRGNKTSPLASLQAWETCLTLPPCSGLLCACWCQGQHCCMDSLPVCHLTTATLVVTGLMVQGLAITRRIARAEPSLSVS